MIYKVLAVWRRYAIEAGDTLSRLVYQGCHACEKVQWFEDDVDSAISGGFLNLAFDSSGLLFSATY